MIKGIAEDIGVAGFGDAAAQPRVVEHDVGARWGTSRFLDWPHDCTGGSRRSASEARDGCCDLLAGGRLIETEATAGTDRRAPMIAAPARSALTCPGNSPAS